MIVMSCLRTSCARRRERACHGISTVARLRKVNVTIQLCAALRAVVKHKLDALRRGAYRRNAATAQVHCGAMRSLSMRFRTAVCCFSIAPKRLSAEGLRQSRAQLLHSAPVRNSRSTTGRRTGSASTLRTRPRASGGRPPPAVNATWSTQAALSRRLAGGASIRPPTSHPFPPATYSDCGYHYSASR